MPAVYTAEEILEIVGGRLASGMIGPEAGSINTDTRQIKEGDWFLALEGRKYDGHDFLGDAFAGGAIGGIVAERTRYSIGSNSFPLIAVDAPSKALSLLARNWRRRISPKVIALCGTSDELTELVDLIAAAERRKVECVHQCATAQEAAQRLLNMSEETRLVVVGLSPSALKEVESAAVALEPNVLAFLPHAFDNLRLTSQPANLKAAKVSLIQNLNKAWAWVLADSPSDEICELAKANQKAALLTCQEKFFEAKAWQARGQSSESLAQDYDKALAAISSRLPLWQAWLYISACGLAGIAPARLIDKLKSS